MSLLNCSFAFQVGKAEFLGRAIGKPNVQLCEEDYKTPSLEWFQIHRGSEDAGELLAAFEMFEVIFYIDVSENDGENKCNVRVCQTFCCVAVLHQDIL